MLEIIRIVPQIEDYSCPISLDLAFKPSKKQPSSYLIATFLNIAAKKDMQPV
jgi:hypothetical protein